MDKLPVQLQMPKGVTNTNGFQTGHPRYGGRRKGAFPGSRGSCVRTTITPQPF